MKRVHRVQTSDGALHENEAEAAHHAERRYAEALRKIALRCVHTNLKCTTIMGFFDANLEELRELLALKDDIAMETEDAD